MSGRLSALGALLALSLAAPAEAARLAGLDDVLTLRDIGDQGGGIALSPDGRHVAYRVHRADADANRYRADWYVAPTDGVGAPLRIASGGDVELPVAADGRVIGTIVGERARWSPDGRWIAFRRSERGQRALWRVRADGTGGARATPAVGPVESFDWAADGRTLEVDFGPPPAIARARRAAEAREGFLADDRLWGSYAALPLEPRPTAVARFSVNPETRALRPLDAKPPTAPPVPHARLTAIAPGVVAWAAPADGRSDRFAPPLTVGARLGARDIACTAAACTGAFTQIWWRRDGEELFMLRRDGANRGRMTLLAWRPGPADPRVVLAAPALLLDCADAPAHVVCLYEAPAVPRRIVGVDRASGRLTTLVDPNPGFTALRLGAIERLEWLGADGHAAFGHLVAPPDPVPGRRYPLVIVQYRSRGFLRGGTGDEYPIFALAAGGAYVLSVDRPERWEVRETARDLAEIEERAWDGLADRRMVLASLEAIVDRLVARGSVDPARLGITGLSDGAASAIYALRHGRHRFAATSISSGGWQPSAAWLVSEAARAQMQALGLATADARATDRLRAVALGQGVQARTPLLMHVADRELVAALEGYAALRATGQPFELRVFENEYHTKWQPRHRRAIYRRNLAWFDYWLHGRDALATADERERWGRWAAGRDPRPSTSARR